MFDNHLCAKCGSEDVSWDNVDVENNAVYQRGSCETCGANWEDQYTLSKRKIEEGNQKFEEWVLRNATPEQ